jgi:hypothetical protein
VIGFVYIRSPVLPLPSTSSFPPTHFFLPALHHLVSSQQQFFTSTSTQVHLGLHRHDEHQSIKVSSHPIELRILHSLFLFTSTRSQGHHDEISLPSFHHTIKHSLLSLHLVSPNSRPKLLHFSRFLQQFGASAPIRDLSTTARAPASSPGFWGVCFSIRHFW